MRTLVTFAAWAFLHISATSAQEPRAENFKRFRAYVIERLDDVPGKRANSNLINVFGIDKDIGIVTDAEMAFAGHRLSLSFATRSSDMFLTDLQKTPAG